MQKERAGVYYAGQDFTRERPAFFVEREVARQWLDENKAWSVHHGRDIALQPEMDEWLAQAMDGSKLISDLLPEQSCVMGEHVMAANVEERLWAQRMVKSWNRGVALAEHLLSLKRYRKIAERGGVRSQRHRKKPSSRELTRTTRIPKT